MKWEQDLPEKKKIENLGTAKKSAKWRLRLTTNAQKKKISILLFSLSR
jgi:hypothetical protein